MSFGTAKYYANIDNMSLDELVDKFAYTKAKPKPKISIRLKGQTFDTLTEACAYFGANYKTVLSSMRRGFSSEEAILRLITKLKR